MITGRTHGVIGAAVAFPIAFSLLHASGVLAVATEGGGILAALAPDMDNPRSLVGHRFHLAVRHRGPTHSLLVALLAAAVAYFIATMAGASSGLALLLAEAIGLCWASHIVADLTNSQPVSILWPLRYRWCLPHPFSVHEYRPAPPHLPGRQRPRQKRTWGSLFEEGLVRVGALVFIAGVALGRW